MNDICQYHYNSRQVGIVDCLHELCKLLEYAIESIQEAENARKQESRMKGLLPGP